MRNQHDYFVVKMLISDFMHFMKQIRKPKLNPEPVQKYLRKESRKKAWITTQLGISSSLLDKMLYDGHVPKEDVVNRLAELIHVKRSTLFLPLSGKKPRSSAKTTKAA